MKHSYLFFFSLFFTISGYAQNNPDNEILVFFSDGIVQETKTVNGKALKAFKFTNERLRTSLNAMGIKDSLIDIALPKFNKADTLITLKSGEKLQQPDMSNLYRVKVPNDKKRQDVIESLNKIPGVLYAEPNFKAVPYSVPSDTRFDEQWSLRNTSRPEVDINAVAAWDIYTGNPNNLIAIIDGGVEITHPDLNDKISGGDTNFGWEGHGTRVAGIAAAESDNAQGISGVDWKARIHPQRIDNVDASGIYQAIVDAVNYNSKVFVLNCSWGSTEYSLTIRQAFAYSYKANRTSVAATGNYQNENPGITSYPAGFDNVIAVGATDQLGYVATFSVHDSHIDVVAPGTDILSTVNGTYYPKPGTSEAAPMVSGIASLLKGFNPNLANDDIENIIQLSATDINSVHSYETGPGWDKASGFGLVNAEKALNLIRSPNTLSQWASTGGTIVSSSGTFKTMLLGVSGLSSNIYVVKRHEVRKSLTYPNPFLRIEGVWGRGVSTKGWSAASPNFGEGFCEVVPETQTNTGVTLRTYIYQIWDMNGRSLGYYPKTSSNVSFAYTVLGVLAPTISGSSVVCNEGISFTLNNLPTGATVEWNYSSNLQSLNVGSNFITLKAINIGNAWLQATITSIYGTYTTPKKDVWAGVPVMNNISGPSGGVVGGSSSYFATVTDAHSNVTSFNWTLRMNNNNYINPNGNYCDIIWYTPGTYVLEVSAQNTCGTSFPYWFPINVSGGSYLSITPNPASGNVKFSLSTDPSNISQSISVINDTLSTLKHNSVLLNTVDKTTHRVRIFNSYGILQYTNSFIGSSFTLSVDGLMDGIYWVEVDNGKDFYTNKFVVKH